MIIHHRNCFYIPPFKHFFQIEIEAIDDYEFLSIFNEETKIWCRSICNEKDWHSSINDFRIRMRYGDSGIYFVNDKDAMLFKLTWGGK